MLALLSPAKSLDYNSPLPTEEHTVPRFIDESMELVSQLRRLSPSQIGSLMSLSEKLSELNAERYIKWESDFNPSNSRQAIFAFTGDVYKGMSLSDWSELDYASCQKQIRILSGLYGVLRPLDLIQPYRLEMGTKLATTGSSNLYQFWGSKLTEMINKDLKENDFEYLINLASNEYFSAVQSNNLDAEIITPVFKDEKNGTFKIISFYAKKARGMMADYIVRNGLSNPQDLKRFTTSGYYYDEASSTSETYVFLRSE